MVGLIGLCLAGTAAAQAAAGGGLRPEAAEALPRLQMRLGMTALSSGPGLRLASPTAAGEPGIRSATLLGDLYLGESGGLRATGGLLLGQRSMPWSSVPRLGQSLHVELQQLWRRASEAPASAKVPYLGLGYSSAAWAGSWGFSADLGLMALAPRRIGGAFSGQRGVEEILRDLRLTPTLQFGAIYAF